MCPPQCPPRLCIAGAIDQSLLMENFFSPAPSFPPFLCCRNIATIAVFYALPVIQLVITYQTVTPFPQSIDHPWAPTLALALAWSPWASLMPARAFLGPWPALLCLLQVVNVTGNQDICYYNFLCAHPLSNLR